MKTLRGVLIGAATICCLPIYLVALIALVVYVIYCVITKLFTLRECWDIVIEACKHLIFTYRYFIETGMIYQE